jgi:hypothetical protein
LICRNTSEEDLKEALKTLEITFERKLEKLSRSRDLNIYLVTCDADKMKKLQSMNLDIRIFHEGLNPESCFLTAEEFNALPYISKGK